MELRSGIASRALLPTEEDYEGVWANRLEFSGLPADGPVSLKVTILGCAEGRSTANSFLSKDKPKIWGHLLSVACRKIQTGTV